MVQVALKIKQLFIYNLFMFRIFTLITITLLLLAPHLQAEENKSLPAANVVVEKAVKKSVAPTAWYSATVISRDDANLAAEISGRLTWVADVGDQFKKGELVAKLDDIFIKQEVIEEQSIIKSEQAKFEFHSKEVERYNKLLADNNVAQNQLDQAISDQVVARSNIASSKARLAQAKERLKRTEILAPFNGVISDRLLQASEWAENGETILRLVNTRNLEIQTHIPASVLRFITIGTPLAYTDGNSNGEGIVRTLVPVGGDVSRLYELRISVTDPTLSAGSLLRVAIPTEHAREVVLVPRDALVLRKEGVYVFRINENLVAERISVETGISEIDSIEILGGINPNDLVVTRGGENLHPGATVTIKPLHAGS